jgi:flavin reductase (DIM6/NTAB) family NADH-FMN oxidoreductase RutF
MTIQLPAVRGDGAGPTSQDFRDFMRRWPGGVAVVTARSGRHPAGCTVNALLSVSLNPPLTLVSLSQQSRTLAAITARHSFGINVLGSQQQRLAERFATAPGDRFAGVPYRLEGGVPVLDGAIAVAVCRLERVIPAADHVLLLGSPQWCDYDGRASPLIFFGSAYQPLSADRADGPDDDP